VLPALAGAALRPILPAVAHALLNSISEQDLDALTLPELAQRMDEVLRSTRGKRDHFADVPDDSKFGIFPTITVFLGTPSLASRSESEQRRLAYRFFSLLLQLEYWFVNVRLGSTAAWRSSKVEPGSGGTGRPPAYVELLIREAAVRQYGIISVRVVMDILMDLLYELANGQPLPSARSRLGRFKRWLLDSETPTPFLTFAHAVLAAHRHDQAFRTPEVHGASRYPRQILLLQGIAIQDEELDLLNVMQSVFGPLYEILHGRRPGQFSGDVAENWKASFLSQDRASLNDQLRALFSPGSSVD
jgi:hypothetical protein